MKIFRHFSVSQAAKNILKYKKSGSVLDLGAGQGRNALFLAKKGFAVTAVDKNSETVFGLRRLAKEKNIKLKTKVASIFYLKDKKIYDIVVAVNVLHFLKEPQVSKAIAIIKIHTKLDGLNVISVHTDKNKPGSRPYLFKPKELRKYYKGWEILKYSEKLGLPWRTSKGKILRRYRATIIAQRIS